jgi:hypothetical protein
MIVFQIILGQVPEHLFSSIYSVERYARINNYQYEVLSKTPEEYIPPDNLTKEERFQWRRMTSDIMRIEFLSFYQESLYVDWDVFLYENFDIPDKSKMAFGGIQEHSKDSVIYNGLELQPFKEMLKRLNHPKTLKHNLLELINSYYQDSQRFSGHYVHFDNCRFKNTLELL